MYPDSRGSVFWLREYQKSCTLPRPARRPPDDLGAELLDFRCTAEHILDDGTHVVKRLALTPLAVLGDVLLLLPFDLWFLIAN